MRVCDLYRLAFLDPVIVYAVILLLNRGSMHFAKIKGYAMVVIKVMVVYGSKDK